MESYQYIEGDEYIFYLCPSWAISVGYIGVIAAVVLSNVGSAWGTWRSGVSIVHTGIRHPSSIMKNIIPVIMSGVIGIYGLIIAIILAKAIKNPVLTVIIVIPFTQLWHTCVLESAVEHLVSFQEDALVSWEITVFVLLVIVHLKLACSRPQQRNRDTRRFLKLINV